MAPLISICIPTHHGRAQTLAEALRSIGEQRVAGVGELVEVCVRDNASADGTEEVVARHAREAPFPVRYRRNSENLGPGRNVTEALAMGTGRWRWPLSSDDALLPGALGHVCWLAARHADAAGLSLAAQWFDRELRQRIAVPCPSVEVRRGAVEGSIEGREAILRRFAQWWNFMSTHLLRGDVMDAVVADRGIAALEPTLFPHVLLFVIAVERLPRWAWSSAAVVASRQDNSHFGHDHEFDYDGMFARIARDLHGLWGTAGDRRLQRELMGDWLRTSFDRESIRVWSARTSSIGGRTRLALTLLPLAWRDPFLWRETLPGLLRPSGGARRGSRDDAGSEPSRPLPPNAMRAALTLEVPERWFAGGGTRIRCGWEHRGDHECPVAAPHPVRLGCRWTDSVTGAVVEESRAVPRVPVAPGQRVQLDLPVVAPLTPGRYTLRIAPVQEQVAWFDDVDPANGVATDVSVELPLAATAQGVAA